MYEVAGSSFVFGAWGLALVLRFFGASFDFRFRAERC